MSSDSKAINPRDGDRIDLVYAALKNVNIFPRLNVLDAKSSVITYCPKRVQVRHESYSTNSVLGHAAQACIHKS